MTEKILYANGCSWTAGDGIQYDPVLNIPSPAVAWPFTRKLNWAQVLSKVINRRCINQATGGGSNLRMVRTTCDFIHNLDKENYKDTIVILGWTTPERSEVYIEENNIKQWCIYNSMQKFSAYKTPFSKSMVSEIDSLQKKQIIYTDNYMTHYTYLFQQMFLMSNMLENLNIRYLFFHSLPWMCDLDKFNVTEIFKKQIQNLKKSTILDSNDPLNVMSTFCYANNVPMAVDQHTMVDGHRLWAENLHRKLVHLYGENL